MRRHSVNVVDESKIVAMLARGDTYPEIQKAFPDSPPMRDTIARIKKRNKENLELIAAKSLQKSTHDAMLIKQKANAKLDKLLDRDDTIIKQLEKIEDRYLNEEIDTKEYLALIRNVKELSVNELVSISKEMHNQTKEEPPTAINPGDAKALAKAIQDGDEVTINQLIWKKAGGQSDPTPEEHI